MRPASRKNYLLGVLTAILLFNFVDRMALGLFIQDIKAELHLTDTEIGFLSGIAFALFYAVMGIPIARWADRGNRITIIAVTTALWGVAVILCGTAGSFLQLLVIRVGVAVGEAGCTPPAFSLLSDFFNRAERPRAAAIYGMGGPLSAIVGLLVAGWLNELYGWRTALMLLGTPGIVLAALVWFTLQEPRLKSASVGQTASGFGAAHGVQPSLQQVAVTLWRNATFRHLTLSGAVVIFFSYGINLWQPAFFIRKYGLSTGEVGTWLAIIYTVGGLLGTYLGGAFSTRYARHNERLQLAMTALAIVTSAVLSFFVYVVSNKYLAFALLALAAIGPYTTNGPVSATLQGLVPERMRAVAFALSGLVCNLIGMGLGPLATGMLSDALRPWAGDESLRYSLLILAPGYFLAAWYLWQASKAVNRDLAAVHMLQVTADDPHSQRGRSESSAFVQAQAETRAMPRRRERSARP